MYAEVVSGLNTSVFRPTPAEVSSTTTEPATSEGQFQTAEALSTVSTKSRPIRLIRSGRPVSPLPVSQSLSGKLPDEITQT